MPTPEDPASKVIPFGKHKGATVAELLAKDPAYAEWLLGQRWLAERFAELHAAILARGAGSDDTPEHNAIQARFLDPLFQAACLLAAAPTQLAQSKADEHSNISSYRQFSRDRAQEKLANHQNEIIRFANRDRSHDLSDWHTSHLAKLHAELPELQQHFNAVDAELLAPLPTISISVAFEVSGVDVALAWSFSGKNPLSRLNVEIKPSLGDDFPSVMRQMQRLRATCLLINAHSGSLPLPTVRDMFKANAQTLVTIRDVEAEIPNARNLIS